MTASERDFLSLVSGAKAWLYEAGENGATTIDRVVETAVQLAECYSSELVDRVLGQVTTFARFSPADIESTAVPFFADGRDQSWRKGSAGLFLYIHPSAWKGFTAFLVSSRTQTSL